MSWPALAQESRQGRAAELPPPHEASVVLRWGDPSDAPALFDLVSANLETGRLLPRDLDDLALHGSRFTVAAGGDGSVIGCAELAPLGPRIAEVRSFVVDEPYRGAGIGTALIQDIRRRARRDGYGRLCAFTHEPALFVRLGFSIVPHVWIPEKIATDCRTCALFRRCGQIAMMCGLHEM